MKFIEKITVKKASKNRTGSSTFTYPFLIMIDSLDERSLGNVSIALSKFRYFGRVMHGKDGLEFNSKMHRDVSYDIIKKAGIENISKGDFEFPNGFMKDLYKK